MHSPQGGCFFCSSKNGAPRFYVSFRDERGIEHTEEISREKEYIPYIDEWMESDRKLPRKQRHTAMRMYTRLAEEHGYTGCYSSVKRYVGKRKRLAEEGYLPLAQPAGAGQVDFGESIYYDANGSTCKGYALTVSFPYSNKGYTQFFPAQNQECLLTGLRRVFEHIGGVPARLKLDNLSAAVAQVLEDGERVLTDGFRRFMLHLCELWETDRSIHLLSYLRQPFRRLCAQDYRINRLEIPYVVWSDSKGSQNVHNFIPALHFPHPLPIIVSKLLSPCMRLSWTPCSASDMASAPCQQYTENVENCHVLQYVFSSMPHYTLTQALPSPPPLHFFQPFFCTLLLT